MAAHIVLPWVDRVFANLKIWALGVVSRAAARALKANLDEFVFRFNRRASPAGSKQRLTPTDDGSAQSLRAVIKANIADGAQARQG